MPDTLTLVKKHSFYQDIVLKIMSRMDKGRLHLTLPDGERLLLGHGEGDILGRVTINNDDFYRQVILYGDIGFGEAYVDGLWDTDNITNVIKWFLLNVDNAPGLSGSKSKAAALNVLKLFNKLSHFKRSNTLEGSRKNISEHYDLNNDFFE